MATKELIKIVIVDDEILIRQGIKHYLNWEQEGYQIVGEASNGKEALEIIERNQPDIVITDIVMPIMDGEELTRIVKSKYPEIEIIVLSSFGEFDYVRSTFQNGVVDYILKPKLDANAILEVLNKAVSRITTTDSIEKKQQGQLSVNYIIEKLLSGFEADIDEKQLSKVFPYDSFCLLGVVFNWNIPRGDHIQVQDNIIQKYKSSIAQATYETISFDKNETVFILNVNKDKSQEVIDFAKKVAETHIDSGFVLSEQFSNLNQIGRIYHEKVKKLIQYRFYFPNIPLLREQDLQVEIPNIEDFNIEWFTTELKHSRFQEAFRYLQDHVYLFSKCYTTDVFEFKSFFENMIFHITVLLNNMEYDVAEIESSKYEYFKSINEANSSYETIDYLNKFIEQVQKCLYSEKNQPNNLNMKKLLQYIDDHYSDQLSLADVAEHFHFNPSYLSTFFSTHNKEGFIEYLNKVRIEKASHFLLKDSTPISEISGMVGYSDHSYFCKVFKKIHGMSPSKFRRKHTRR
ncbi:response regulator transcription factor [Bacillus timonensis]|uniref:response regulator transcription factor n=1 Tax=Bacillus timonensis TaxID=1033734 RepID=UPI000289B7F8|nr:response regulator transcription factor [Bacillus timonensis]